MRYEVGAILQLIKMVSEGSPEALEKGAQGLCEQSQSLLQDTIQAVMTGTANELSELKKENRKFRRLLASLPRTERDDFYYEAGIFNGVYGVVVGIHERILIQEEQSRHLGLLERKHVTKILRYLYENPHARQKCIAKDANIQANYLSEILNRLLQAGFVERVGKNKTTQYYLTKTGRQIVRSYVLEPESEESFIDVDFRELQEKGQFLEKREKERTKISLGEEGIYANTKWKANFGGYFKTTFYG
ncbi:MAG: winged helix-turn-helix transcriptional regulator [Lachnospiraceae bacterium]|nr:winged helix-turn-helix transcriptional regulator [Lachnospiraceae bacterium]